MLLSYVMQRVNTTYLKVIMSKRKMIVTRRNFAACENSIHAKLSNEPEFTTDQQKYLLETLNQADTEQLVRYNVPKNRIKGFYDWRKRNGQFNSLTDLLYVEGLGIKTLNKICKRIIDLENGDEETEKLKRAKSRGQILSPTMNLQQNKDLKTALGIHLYANGISWARLKRDQNTLVDWDSYEFNINSKKLSPIDALHLVIKVCRKIPTSDVYIFETPTSVTPTAQQSAISVAAYAQRVQFLSMLITLLSTNLTHNPAYAKLDEATTPSNKNDPEFNTESKIYFLRHKLSARLFRTLIGTERVSAAATVSRILSKGENDKNVHTPLTVDTDLHNWYNKQLPVNKEVLGQALLLIMTFMDICIYQNPQSLKAISSYCR